MKLRDHPLMVYRGVPNWPPVWLERYNQEQTIRGEVGVLKYAVLARDRRGDKCYLYITHDGLPWIGTLLFDDTAFCKFVSSFLKEHIGERIEDIASLDVSETL